MTADEQVIAIESERAANRLRSAIKAERATSSLPPNCADRETVLTELRDAEAVAEEFTR